MKEAGITPEQAEKMAEMRERLWKVDGDLRVVCSHSYSLLSLFSFFSFSLPFLLFFRFRYFRSFSMFFFPSLA